MDRATISALTVAGASVILSLMMHHNANLSGRYAIMLAFLVAIIAFPQAIEAGFRSTLRGSAHGGEEPTPGIIIRVAAWGLLIIVVTVHHTVAFFRIPVQPGS